MTNHEKQNLLTVLQDLEHWRSPKRFNYVHNSGIFVTQYGQNFIVRFPPSFCLYIVEEPKFYEKLLSFLDAKLYKKLNNLYEVTQWKNSC